MGGWEICRTCRMNRKLHSVAEGNGTYKVKRQERFPVPAFSAQTNKPRISPACGIAERRLPPQPGRSPGGGACQAQERRC